MIQHHALLLRRAQTEPPHQALHDGEDVVEIMRHAGGELAERLHLLRLAQLRFEAQALGHILAVGVNARLAGERKE